MPSTLDFNLLESNLLRISIEQRYEKIRQNIQYSMVDFSEAILIMPSLVRKLRGINIFAEIDVDCGYILNPTIPVDDDLIASLRIQARTLALTHLCLTTVIDTVKWQHLPGYDKVEDMLHNLDELSNPRRLSRFGFRALQDRITALWGEQVFEDMMGRHRRNKFPELKHIQLS